MVYRSGPLTSDAELWVGFCRRDLSAVEEIYRRHGASAFAVAMAIMQDRARAEQAVIAAFARLSAAAARHGLARSLRAEVLAAVRRCASDAAPLASLRTVGSCRGLADVLDRQAPDVRDTLALALGGPCRADEIAEIMDSDRATVGRDILAGLCRARTLLDQSSLAAPAPRRQPQP